MTVRCSAERWPLVILELSGPADRAHSDCLIRTLSTQITRGRCAVLLDTRSVQLADSLTAIANIQREARWLREHELLIERNVTAFALVLEGVAVNFLFSSLLALVSIPTHWTTTPQIEEGMLFCSQALEQRRSSRAPLKRPTSLSSFPPPA